MQQIFFPIPNPPYVLEVVYIQRKLNTVRWRFHHTWEYLQDDGRYGPKTAEAVKRFQQAYNIEASGRFDYRTSDKLEELLCSFPVIKAAEPLLVETNKIEENEFSFIGVIDEVKGFIETLSSLVEEEIDYAKNMGKCDPPKKIVDRIRFKITSKDSQVAKLNKVVRTNLDNKNVKDTLQASIKNRQTYNARSFSDTVSIQKTHQKISYANTRIKITANEAVKISNSYIDDLQKFNLVEKIANKLKELGITGEIKINQVKSIKINVGLIGLAWNLKDILVVLSKYEEWGKEEWKQELNSKCYEYLDGLIMSAISMFISKLLVAGVVAVTGFTLSAGWMLVIVVLVSVLVAALIGFIISKITDDSEFSFTQFVFEGAALKIIETVYKFT